MKKHIIPLFLLLFVPLIILSSIRLSVHTNEKSASVLEELSTKLLRFHVIANSDSQIDQEKKLLVKESVLNLLSPYLANVSTKEEAKQIIRSHTEEIIAACQSCFDSKQNTPEITTELASCYFPIKTYGEYTFPPGNYEAFVIRLGKAEGKNWWCVMYPPLCFVDASYGTVPENSKEELEYLLSENTYDQLIQKERSVQIKFKLLSFLNRFLKN